MPTAPPTPRSPKFADGDAGAIGIDMNIARVRDASRQGAGADANADRFDAGRAPGNSASPR